MADSSTAGFSSSDPSPAVSSPAILVQNIVRRHGRVTAVDHVTFEVRRGEFFSILGPSGAGKTSVLRMLAGFEEPDEGDVRIDGSSVVGVPPNRRPVNLVFQSYALFPHLTVFENVAFGLRMRGAGQSEIEERVRAALEMVRLIGKEGRAPSQLSGGEQQRVALARALVNRPAVVLLDEPLAALDQQLRQEMQVELKAIQERAGLTCVCVTHHQEEAMLMSDRIAVMHQGRMLQIGTPREVYAEPANLFVARFLGVSNELVGTLQDAGTAGVRVHPIGSDAAPVRVSAAPRPVDGGRVILSLRPEQVRLVRSHSPACENSLPGRIEKVLFAGSTTTCLVRLAPDRIWEVPVGSEQNEEKPFEAGDAVTLQWRATDGRLFFE